MKRGVDGVLILFLLLAAALRFPGLGMRSLWFDEALSALIARLPAAQVWANAAGSSHPPGHYMILHLWRFMGSNEFALRFPSAWCSLLAVALVARLGRCLEGRRMARLAALGMAIAPFQVYYAQEARMYSLAIALNAGVLWSFLDGVWRGGRRIWAAYGALAVAALYVHYYSALLLLALHLWLLLDLRRARRVILPLAIADLVAGLAFAPQAAQFLIETREYLGGMTSWQSPPSALSPLTTLYYLLFGHVLPLTWVWAGLFFVLALLALGGLTLARRKRMDGVWALAFVIGAPLVVVLLISWMAHSIYSERSFAVLTPALVLFLAWSAAGAPRRSPAPIVGAVLAALMMAGSVWYHASPDPAKPPVREAAMLVARESRAADVVLHLQDASYLPAFYYARQGAGALLDTGQRLWAAPDVYALFGARVIRPDGLSVDGRVWLTVMPGYVGAEQAEWLARWDAAHAPVETWEWEGVQVRLYDGGAER